MNEEKFTDADKNRIDSGWYISTLKGHEGELVYFREMWQTRTSWVVETSSGERFLDKCDVQEYRRVKDITKYLGERESNLNWAKRKNRKMTISDKQLHKSLAKVCMKKGEDYDDM